MYVLDTNSIRVLRNYYPQRFPSFWKLLGDAVDQGSVISVREAHTELLQQLSEEWFLDWIKKNRHIFVVPGPAETQFVARIFSVPHFQALVGEKRRLQGKPVADPFVVAAAAVRGWCVVTEEELKPHAAKIPNACEHFGVACTDLEGFMAQNKWSF